MRRAPHQVYSFDRFCLDLTRGCLLCEEQEIRLRPKSFEVLKFLVENSGRLVGKEELIHAVWSDSFVTDDSLIKCLKEVRVALRDDSQQYIKTVPRRGYIFVAKVTENKPLTSDPIHLEKFEDLHVSQAELQKHKAEKESIENAQQDLVPVISFPLRHSRSGGDTRIERERVLTGTLPASATAAMAPQARWLRAMRWSLAGLMAALLIFGAWWIWGRIAAPASTNPVRVQRLTDFAGLKEFPAISPDGKSLVFTADTGGKRQLWLRLLAGGAPLQITHDPIDHLFPRWSRDSASIIYFSPSGQTESHGTLWEISALGGAPRRIASSLGGGDVSPDDKQIAFFRFNNGRTELAVASRDGSNPQVITPLNPNFYYFYPRWSPDAQWIGYQRKVVGIDYTIFVVPAKRGEPRQVVHDFSQLNGFAWKSDSSGIIYSSTRGNTTLYLPTFNLWTVSRGGDGLRQLTFGEASYVHPDLSGPGKVVVSRIQIHSDIWKYPVDGSALENVRRGVQITRQTGQVLTPSIGPDDKELVYLSDSGGHANLWVMKLDSGEVRQLTNEQDPMVAVGVPVWSPDGKHIAFVLKRPGDWAVELWLVSPDGSNRRKVEDGASYACWSSDSRWLYYVVLKQGIIENLKKIRADGGAPVQVRRENVWAPAIAPDGTLYYALPLAGVAGVSDLEIRIARPENGPSQLLTRIPGLRIPAWQIIGPVISPDGKWLALPLNDGPVTNIWALPSSGEPMRQITDFGQRHTFIARRVSWSSDGHFIFAAVGEGDADVVLLDGLVP